MTPGIVAMSMDPDHPLPCPCGPSARGPTRRGHRLRWALMPWLLCLTACAHQGGLTADDRDAIRAVIERQLEAFHREDAAAAFAFASPEIQAKYGSPEYFMTIVKTFYEPVYRPRRLGGFTKLHVVDGQPTQPVLLVGPDGDFTVALYTMKKQVHGEWRILGCSLVP
jgi:Domain of unknown function (DUF4864)